MQKLDSPLTHYTVLKVEGRGTFPLDMLRYDACYPATGEDAKNMRASHDEVAKWTIFVKKNTSPKYAKGAVWTLARWESFHCTVSAVE